MKWPTVDLLDLFRKLLSVIGLHKYALRDRDADLDQLRAQVHFWAAARA